MIPRVNSAINCRHRLLLHNSPEGGEEIIRVTVLMTLPSIPAEVPNNEENRSGTKQTGPPISLRRFRLRRPQSCCFPGPRRLAGPRGSSPLHLAAPGEAAGPGGQDPRRLRHFVPLAARPAREPKMAAARLRRRATAKLDTVPIPQRRGDAAAIFNRAPPHPAT